MNILRKRDILQDTIHSGFFFIADQIHGSECFPSYESIVAGYSLPDPRGFDPTAIMAPFFACFFGMMVSDAGYGMVMAIMIPLIIHFLHPPKSMRNMMYVLTAGGVFTVIWGTIYDTWFGANLNPKFLQPILINALEDPMKMMFVCIGMGVIHLFTGVGVAAYMNIKRGKPWSALFDQGFWILMLVGIGLMLAVPSVATAGKFMALGGAVGILLTAGREKPTVLGKIMGGFGALYGVSSWLGDILSYMRLFGMGLATGVIGMVINLVANMLWESGVVGMILAAVVFVGGHIFNLAINALGAYVHSCRLQYIEFFSRFYEDGGRAFKPLCNKTKYVDIAQKEAA